MSSTFVLASASPQRKVLLEQMGIQPIVVPAVIPEDLDSSRLHTSLEQLARDKASASLATLSTTPDVRWVLGADTVIYDGTDVIGKASDRKSAYTTLQGFSGRAHEVLTGVCVLEVQKTENGNRKIAAERCSVAATTVRFKHLSEKEIGWYLDTDEWREAAGSYRIQGKGACLIEGIAGSYSNVVGLPIELIYGILSELDFDFGTG